MNLDISTLETSAPRLAETPAYVTVRGLLQDILPFGDVGAIAGPSGAGKTFAAEALVARCEMPVHHLSFTRSPSRKEVLFRVLRSLSGRMHRGEAYVLETEARELLADRELLLVVDEAHWLDQTSLAQLSTLHGDQAARWSLLYLGGPKLVRTLEQYEHLRSRCARIVEVTTPRRGELLTVLRSMHETYRWVGDKALLDIDAQGFSGNLRDWTRHQRTMVRLSEEHGAEADDGLAYAALAYMRRGPR